ncbi:MAG TPA: BON domain-containing protein [Candidatus Sulfotelmatobacter sp.]|nr:BON domain-containing protein [Candidatus Sulfotelmatobacter sp.]
MLIVMLSMTMAHGMDHVVPDAQITAEIQIIFVTRNIFKHGQVQVRVEHGVATLPGMVDSIGVKTDAQNAAMKDEDVLDTVNDVLIETNGITSIQIVARARRRLLRCYAYTVYDYVEFEAHENTLVILGEVTQPYKKVAIDYNVAHVKGVAAIENKINVLPLSSYDDGIRMQIARAIYDDPYFSEYVDAGQLPIHIVVSDENIMLEGVVDSQEDRVRAAEDANIVTSVELLTNNLRIAGNR